MPDPISPTISVVMPTNRGGVYLDEAVASVRAQTFPVHEIILVDDGSPPPGLGDTAARLGLRYVRRTPGGISAARNTGVEAATGRWIAFLDDDDRWEPERLEQQVQALAAQPEAIAAFTGGYYMDADGVRFGTPWPAPAASSAAMLSYRVPPPRITTLLVRADVYTAVGGCRTEMEPSEDNDLMLRLLQAGEFAAVDAPLVAYRRHTGNLTVRGLAGRRASRRIVHAQIAAAEERGDEPDAALLRTYRHATQRPMAEANLDELIAAVRTRAWSYAFEVTLWAVTAAPVASCAALLARVRRRAASA